MEHQYPGPISGDENMLAELMLPDQAHVRSEDWTIFFLHKDVSEEEELKEERRLERMRRKEERQRAREATRAVSVEIGESATVAGGIEEDSGEEDEDEGGEGPPLIYVLNLVNTKQDSTVKRLTFFMKVLSERMLILLCRGAVVKAMAICTRHSFLHIYKVSEAPRLSSGATDPSRSLYSC